MIKPYYEHANQKIFLGDCRSILPEIGKVDLVLTDPPYGICEQPGKVQMRGVVTSPDYEEWDTHDFSWIKDIRCQSAIIFHDQKLSTELTGICGENGLKLKQFFFWDKGDSGINPRRNYVNAVEVAGFFVASSDYTWNGGGACINIVRLNRCPTPFHPTQKPVELIKKLAVNHSNPGQTVLDPFLGSGTTLVACKQLGRKGIGIEINSKYCDIAIKRLSQECFDFPTEEDSKAVSYPGISFPSSDDNEGKEQLNLFDSAHQKDSENNEQE